MFDIRVDFFETFEILCLFVFLSSELHCTVGSLFLGLILENQAIISPVCQTDSAKGNSVMILTKY